ncbi:MAG: RdgB/HAM1 family non-canonical purine NTP pyrophosphatase [Blastocatellia bacterium]|nr:RdgB/HAM1 family non-canonical purine NTP pyrophosphatase [Blastocatellia bacterium]
MQKLLIATTNAGKVREISLLMGAMPYEVVGLKDLPAAPPPVEETGTTFTANAILKSEYYFAETGLLSLADDSGLEVDALDGAPGVYSARFAGEDATDADRVVKLLELLRDVPDEARTARFVCSLALTGNLNGATQTCVFEGFAEGLITHAPRGSSGFGYDPVFFDEGVGRTFAELTREEKSARSHRGKALAAAKAFLQKSREI